MKISLKDFTVFSLKEKHLENSMADVFSISLQAVIILTKKMMRYSNENRTQIIVRFCEGWELGGKIKKIFLLYFYKR